MIRETSQIKLLILSQISFTLHLPILRDVEMNTQIDRLRGQHFLNFNSNDNQIELNNKQTSGSYQTQFTNEEAKELLGDDYGKFERTEV